MHIIVELLKLIIEKRKMIFELAKSDFKKRFAGSYFGVVWMFVQPVATVLIYFFIFQLGMKSVPPIPGFSYVIWLIPGIVPWFFFQDAVFGLTNSMQEYHYLVKKVVFPVELLLVIKVLSSLMVHGCFVLIMLAVFVISGNMPSLFWLQIVYFSFAATVLALGIGYFTAAINVFFKDMTQIVSICMQFGMWLAPIMYWEGLFTNERPWMAPIFKINPFYYIVSGYRDSMLTGDFLFARPLNTLYFWLVTFIIFYIGLKVFTRLRPHFSDVL